MQYNSYINFAQHSTAMTEETLRSRHFKTVIVATHQDRALESETIRFLDSPEMQYVPRLFLASPLFPVDVFKMSKRMSALFLPQLMLG